jgi:hypothetical protein
MLSVKAFAHGIERTGANIAVYDAKAGETEQNEPISAMLGRCYGRWNTSRISNGWK